MSTAVALPYPLIYPQMAQMARMAQMDDKALTQAERALSEQYWVTPHPRGNFNGWHPDLRAARARRSRVGPEHAGGNSWHLFGFWQPG